MQQWHVGVATQGRDHLAAAELNARGFAVHVPMQYAREIVKGKKVITCTLFLNPYFFVRFDTQSDEEHSLVLKQRGVEAVLLDMKRMPGVIDTAIIVEHRAREHAERNSAAAPRAKKNTQGLELNKLYIIKRHAVFEGRTGKLVGLCRGVAYLDWAGGLITIPDCDIAPYGWLPVEQQKATAA
jgi:hypothetical protein